MAGEVHADFGGLAGEASALQASAAPSASPTGVIGPGLDSVSMAMAVHVNALAQSLDAHLAAASAQRQAAATVTTATVATFEAADAANSSQMLAVASGGTSAPLPGALPPPSPAAGLPTVPAGLGAVPPPSVGAVELGEAFSTAIHSGPGPASLQAAAATWRARSGVESQKADQVQQAGSSIRSDWKQGSGGNTAADAIDEHAKWSHEAVTHAAGIAKLADNYAQAFTDARARTPTPAEFADLRNKLAKAQALQAQYGPRYTPMVLEISQAIVDKQGEASGAASWFQQALQSAATDVGKTLSAAPNIVKPGGTGKGPLSGDDKGKQAGHKPGAPDESGAGFGGGATGALDGVDPAAANPLNSDAMSSVGEVAGSIMGSGMGALQSLGSAGGGGNPASGLSSALPGLSSLGAPQMPSPGQGGGGEQPSAPEDLGAGGGSTTPAAGDFGGGSGGGGTGGGGGGASGGSLGASTVSASPTVGSTAPVGGPATPAGSGMGGGGMVPPMGGGGKKGGEGAERDRKLNPDKRLLMRPEPHVEAVLGEVEIKRSKRDKPNEESK